MTTWAPSPIGFSTVSDSIDHDAADRVFNRVEDAVISHTDSVGVRGPFKLFSVRGSGIGREGLNRMLNASPKLGWQAAELSSGRSGVEDGRHPRAPLALWSGVHFSYRDEGIMPMGLEVGDVFEVTEELNELPKFIERQLNSSASASGINDVLGVKFYHHGL